MLHFLVVEGLMSSLGLFPFMDRGIIPNDADVNDLKAGYYVTGDFTGLVNSPFSTGWGGIVSLSSGFYTLQFASDMSSKAYKVRQRWNVTWTDWKTVSLT